MYVHVYVNVLCVYMCDKESKRDKRQREREGLTHLWYRWFFILECCSSNWRFFFSEAGEYPAADAPCPRKLLTSLAFDFDR